MTSEEATIAVIDALEELSIAYMLVGSFSTNFYGVPRSTQDADFVVHLAGVSVGSLMQRLGPEFQLDPQISFETVTATTRYLVQVVGLDFSIELFLLGSDAHDQERFSRRRRVPILGREASVPTIEDVVITKLRWASQLRRPKDLEDVRNVIAVQGQNIDWDYVNKWCKLHGTSDQLDQVRRAIPPV